MARRGARLGLIGSLLLHAAALLALLVQPRAPESNFLTPPAEMALVFEPNQPTAAQVPEQRLEAPPNVSEPQPSPQPQSQPPAAPTETPEPAVPPAPTAPAAPPAPPTVNLNPPAPLSPQPPPPLALAPDVPIPPLPPLRAPPAPPAPRPAPATRAAPAAQAQRGGFPKPLFRDFFIPPAGDRGDPTYRAFQAANQHATRTGPTLASLSDAKGAAELGSDWSSRFIDWVDQHKFYPDAAAERGEQGEATVSFTVHRDGHVTGLELIGRSGSVFLDAALQSMLRGNRLPRFPESATQDSVVIELTMHYILR